MEAKLTMENTFEIDNFKPLLNQDFDFPIEGQEDITLALVEVNSLTRHMEGGREPFSLIFKGPSDPAIPQGTYVLNHHGLGKLVLFLVPTSSGSSGIMYESLFN